MANYLGLLSPSVLTLPADVPHNEFGGHEKGGTRPIETDFKLGKDRKTENQVHQSINHPYYYIMCTNNNDYLIMNKIKEHLFEVPT